MVLLNKFILLAPFLPHEVRTCLLPPELLFFFFFFNLLIRLWAHHVYHLLLFMERRSKAIPKFVQTFSHLHLFGVFYLHIFRHFNHILVVKRNFHLLVLGVYFLVYRGKSLEILMFQNPVVNNMSTH